MEEVLLGANVPIIKLRIDGAHEVDLGFSGCEVSQDIPCKDVNRRLSINFYDVGSFFLFQVLTNTELLRTYSTFDIRLRKLVICLKAMAKVCRQPMINLLLFTRNNTEILLLLFT